MLKNILLKGGKVLAQALLAAVLTFIADMLIYLVLNYKPTGQQQIIMWSIMQAILTAAIAALKRWAQFDWSKVGK